jgi:hypothetical protein
MSGCSAAQRFDASGGRSESDRRQRQSFSGRTILSVDLVIACGVLLIGPGVEGAENQRQPNAAHVALAAVDANPAEKADAGTVADSKNSASRSAALVRAVNHARFAIVGRDSKSAERYLDLAEQNSISSGEASQVARLRALVEQLDHFFDAVRVGLTKFEPAEELMVDGTPVAIVEVGPGRLALFVEGSRREYTLATLPFKVALVVAEAGSDKESPKAKVFWGAFQAADPQGDRAVARRLWEAAAASGEPVGDLLPFLEPSALAIQREPAPVGPVLSQAKQEIDKKFSQAIDAAGSRERKTAVVSQWIAAAHAAEDSARQYAALKQACHWATAAADGPTAVAAIDELARWFDVDALSLKSQALAEVAVASSTPSAARQIGEIALELAAHAQVAARPELAKSLADTAVAAARKARDPQLLKRARIRQQQSGKPPKNQAPGRRSG